MRHPVLISLCIAGIFALSACQQDRSKEAAKALKEFTESDQAGLNALMLQAANPEESVSYFSKASAANPENIDYRRGLAKSLVRAKKPLEGAQAWREVIAMPGATNDDRVELADALIRNNQWKEAEAVLNQIPPTHETFERYRLEAMVADSKKNWKKADSFYETAFGLTTKPSGVLNNWGFSKLSRGDYAAAEKLFSQSLTYDPTVFTTKNNLVLARAAQRKYDMPIVQMTQAERAQLLYTAALSAIKQGDVATGRTLLQEAVDTAPQYFEEAQRALDTLDASVTKG